MLLPREILEHIASFLNANDQYHCLIVCKYWYHPFLYSLYRSIDITSNKGASQLKHALLSHGSRSGCLVRRISFSSARPLRLGLGVQLIEQNPVSIDQDILNTLEDTCPMLESLQFDQSQWDSKTQLALPLLRRLTQLPALNFSMIIPLMDQGLSHLTHLHIRGNVDLIQSRVSVMHLLAHTPQLTRLVLERDNIHNKYKTPVVSLEHLDTIHQCLPKLTDLHFINHFNFGISNYYQRHVKPIVPRKGMLNLKLEGTLQAYQWIQYISEAYPSLQRLYLDLVHSPFSNVFSTASSPSMQLINHNIRKAFEKLAESYRHLQLIDIRGLSSPLWLTHSLLSALKKKSMTTKIDAQLYGLDSDGVDRAVTTLTNNKDYINLMGIRLPIWRRHSHHANPDYTWRDTIRPLAVFQELAHVELDAVSMSHVVNSNPDEGFELDVILNQLPSLTHLKLSGSTLQISSHNANSCSANLVELVLNKIGFSSDVMTYLSVCCLGLKRLVMYDCQQREQNGGGRNIDIYLDQLKLDLLVLYRVQHSYQLVQSRVPGARFLCINQHWSHLSEDEEGVCKVHPITDQSIIERVQQRMDDDFSLEEWDPHRARYHTQDECMQDLVFGYINVRCKSINKVFLDECPVV